MHAHDETKTLKKPEPFVRELNDKKEAMYHKKTDIYAKKSGQKSKKCPKNAKENLTTPTDRMGLHSNKEMIKFPHYYYVINLISCSLNGP